MAKPLTAERRAVLVTRIVEDHITTHHEGGSHEDQWLSDLLTKGFNGFANYTDAELRSAYDDAGLAEQHEDEEDDDG